MQVSPFGHSRIDGYLRLPETFRSLSRPSSALSAKAFPLCSFSLDLAECSSDTTFLFYFCLKSINLSFSAFLDFFDSFFLFIQFSRCSCQKLLFSDLVEITRFELVTPCLQGRCSPS